MSVGLVSRQETEKIIRSYPGAAGHSGSSGGGQMGPAPLWNPGKYFCPPVQ